MPGGSKGSTKLSLFFAEPMIKLGSLSLFSTEPTFCYCELLKFRGLHPYIKDKNLLCLRYIDDLFFIWKETEEGSFSCFEIINKAHLSIKFDFRYS